MSDTNTHYKEYLESYAWKALKKTKLEEQPDCEACWEPATTVHHLSYERRWSERADDIVSICENCHNECHYIDGYQIKNDAEILKRRFEDVKLAHIDRQSLYNSDYDYLGDNTLYGKNFRVTRAVDWELIKIKYNSDYYNVNWYINAYIAPTWDIWEFAEGIFKWEQLFTFSAALRETKKQNMKMATSEEWDDFIHIGWNDYTKCGIMEVDYTGIYSKEDNAFNWAWYNANFWALSQWENSPCFISCSDNRNKHIIDVDKSPYSRERVIFNWYSIRCLWKYYRK